MPREFFQYLVIGGGSGGIASARRAAQYGAKVGLIEGGTVGGTCVNVGCVPKKIMFNISSMLEASQDIQYSGFSNLPNFKTDVQQASFFDYPKLHAARDAYIKRLNGIYMSNLEKEKVSYFQGFAKFVNSQRPENAKAQFVVSVDNGRLELEAEHVLVATGSEAVIPDNVPGALEHGITSDGFFSMKEWPKKVAIVGSGYIAVELAGVLNHLGTKVHLFVRHSHMLRSFDVMIQEAVDEEYEKHGIKVHKNSSVEELSKTDAAYTVKFTEEGSESQETGFDKVIFAIGRNANTKGLDLPGSVAKNSDGSIKVDEWQSTSHPGMFAVGDVIGHHMLTPVAIAAGRRLSDRLFGGKRSAKLAYENVPSVIFSHPPCGAVGLTEKEAVEKFGKDNIKIYNSKFFNMYYCFHPQESKSSTRYKLICAGSDQKVVGLHLFGKASDEILQGFSVAIKMGATKADFDDTVAIHPTASEEIVTLR